MKKEDNITETVKGIIKSYYPQFFSTDNDNIWKNWVEKTNGINDFEENEENEITKFLSNKKVSDTFKLRALFTFLCLEGFTIRSQVVIRFFGFWNFPLNQYKKLSPQLKDCFSDVIVYLASQKKLSGYPLRMALRSYEAIELVPILPYEKQVKIFEHITMYDHENVSDEDDDDTFSRLLLNKDIPLEFKKKGSQMMYEHVVSKYKSNEGDGSFGSFIDGLQRMIGKDYSAHKEVLKNKSCDEDLLFQNFEFLSKILNNIEKKDLEVWFDVDDIRNAMDILDLQKEETKKLCLQVTKDLLIFKEIRIIYEKDLWHIPFFIEKCKTDKDKNILWLEKFVKNNNLYFKNKKKKEEAERAANKEAAKINLDIKNKSFNAMLK